ncbi:MAG: cytosine permease [Actinomycetota bacterium]|nr:cytosine permease [Actinomycetota bacterium]
MSETLQRLSVLPDRGIEPIPLSERTLSGFDLAILWGDLAIGLLVLVAGGLLVPGLGFMEALLAIVLGSVAGVALLALAGVAGADHGVPTMVLLRPTLGLRGSWAPSVLNGLQLIGWTAVELWAMSFVADIVSERIFGFSARWLWLMVAAVVCTSLALWGPVGVTRVWMKRFGAWIVGGVSVVVTILALRTEGIGDLLTAPGTGDLNFGVALDLVIALPVSWVPLVADYTRFSKSPRAAFGGTFWGYLFANIWLYGLGALLVLSTNGTPSPSGMAAGILALAGGSIAGILFLVGLLAGETDEAFADIYSGAVCIQNMFPNASQRVLAVGITAVSTVLAGWLTMERYEAFLFLIGSIFVPLFGVLAADYFVRRRRSIDVHHLYEQGGRYWFKGGFRIESVLPWFAGFAIYHWILPTGPTWWLDAIGKVVTPVSDSVPWISASVVAFAASFAIALAFPDKLGSRHASVTGDVYHPDHQSDVGVRS